MVTHYPRIIQIPQSSLKKRSGHKQVRELTDPTRSRSNHITGFETTLSFEKVHEIHQPQMKKKGPATFYYLSPDVHS